MSNPMNIEAKPQASRMKNAIPGALKDARQPIKPEQYTKRFYQLFNALMANK